MSSKIRKKTDDLTQKTHNFTEILWFFPISAGFGQFWLEKQILGRNNERVGYALIFEKEEARYEDLALQE